MGDAMKRNVQYFNFKDSHPLVLYKMVNPCEFYDHYLKRYIRHRHLGSIVGNATALRLSSFFYGGILAIRLYRAHGSSSF